jgi:gluconolactonase
MVDLITDFQEVLDKRFSRLVNGNARLERLWTGCRWAEGPAYFPAGRYLIWSDIPNDRMMRYDETSGQVSVFRHPAGYSNGNTVDRQGRLVSCEHGNRRVTRTEHDGSIWVTDPPYGSDSDYEGHKGEREVDGCHVYRVDGASGAITKAADDFVCPNGIAFSRDEKLLYIVDTGVSHVPDGPRHMRRFAVSEDGKLSGGEVFATCPDGVFDGFRLDTEGRIWTSARSGVLCYDPDGTLIGKIKVPEVVANVCFGGIKRNRLFICGTTSLYSLWMMGNGHKTF